MSMLRVEKINRLVSRQKNMQLFRQTFSDFNFYPCGDVLISFAIFDGELYVFVFWTDGWIKQGI